MTRRVPKELTQKLEPAEIFHEVLEHRWYLAERARHDIPIFDALEDYLSTVLPSRPDEATVVGVDTTHMPVLAPPSAG